MLSFSTNIGKELGFISPLGSDKSASDNASGDILGVLPDDMPVAEGGNEADGLLLGAKKRKLFKDVFSDISRRITTKQCSENGTFITEVPGISLVKGAALTTNNDLNLQDLLSSDFAMGNVENGLDENVVSNDQTLDINDKNFACLQDKIAINNEIKYFVQKFSDNKTTFEKSSKLEKNILSDWDIASKLNLQILDTDTTTNTLNNLDDTLTVSSSISTKLDRIISSSSDNNQLQMPDIINSEVPVDDTLTVTSSSISTKLDRIISSSSDDNQLQIPDIINSEVPVTLVNKETKEIKQDKIEDKINDVELNDNTDLIVQTSDALIEHNSGLLINKNIVSAVLQNTETVNETTTKLDSSISDNKLSFSNSTETYSTKVFDNNNYTAFKPNYRNNKQISNNLNINEINNAFDSNEVLPTGDLPNATEVPARFVTIAATKKGKNNNDNNGAEFKITHSSNNRNINKIDDINVAAITPSQGNKSNVATTINSNKIDNIKVVLSKLLNLTPDSTTFGDKNIMLTTHKNTPTQFSVNMDEVLDIQSIEISSEAIGTKQVSDWVKTMPASKVNYITTNESYNLLENVVNNIVDKFYADSIEHKDNSFKNNKLPADNNTALKQISLKFDNQTATEYKLSTSSIINEIFAKIESTAPGDTFNPLLNQELKDYTVQKAVTLPMANSKPMSKTVYSNDILFNINEIPSLSKDSNLDIFIQEDSWEVLFDISNNEEHVIFHSDFKNTDVLSNNEFSEVKLNIMSNPEEQANVVDNATKSYTVKNYKESENVVNNAMQNTKNISTILDENIIFNDINMDTNGNLYVEIEDNSVVNNTKDLSSFNTTKTNAQPSSETKNLSHFNETVEQSSIPVAKPYHVDNTEVITDSSTNYKNDYANEKNSESKLNITSNLDATNSKKTNGTKNIVTSDNKRSYENTEEISTPKTTPTKLENNSGRNIPLTAFNLSELANDKTGTKTVSKNTKITTNTIINKVDTDDDAIKSNFSTQNVSLKNINSKDVSTENNFQPVYNQVVSDNITSTQAREVIQSDEITTQPIVNKENTVDIDTIQQETNTSNIKTNNDTQPVISRTFINVKPQEVHRVVWHTADNMLQEGSKTATKSIKIVMNPQSLGDVIVEIKLQDNVANVSFKTKSSEALNEIEKNIGALKDMLISSDIKTTEFKYEKINTTNENNKNFGEFNQQQNNQQQSKNNQQQARREFLNSVLNDNDSIKHDVTLQNSFYKLVEEYV